MAKLATRFQIESGTAGLAALRAALKDVDMGAHGSDADREVRSLKKSYEFAAFSMQPLLSDNWNPTARNGTVEFARLAREAEQIIAQLSRQAAYRGLRRGSMTVAQKTKFIEENGEQEFLSLPY